MPVVVSSVLPMTPEIKSARSFTSVATTSEPSSIMMLGLKSSARCTCLLYIALSSPLMP